MTPTEIRAVQPGKSQADGYGGWNKNTADAMVFCGVMLQELAAQLAELNEKLDPARLVNAIEEIQAEMDKRDGGHR